MKSKTKNLTWIPSILVALVIIMGACMKLTSASQLVEIYSKIGLLPYLRALGVTELLFTGIFLYPRTMRIGLLLLTGYFGGAMAVELSHGTVFIFPATILVFAWIGAYLRDRSLFLGDHKTEIEGAIVAKVKESTIL
jgi:hypothetical protein